MLLSCSTLFSVCYSCNSDVMIILLGTKFIQHFLFLPYMCIIQHRCFYNGCYIGIGILIHLMINVMMLVVNVCHIFI